MSFAFLLPGFWAVIYWGKWEHHLRWNIINKEHKIFEIREGKTRR
jgi:hypothetical protein